jgi:hypothetical protein
MRGYVAKRRNRFDAVIYEGSTRTPDANGVAGIQPVLTGAKPSSSPPASPAAKPVAAGGQGRPWAAISPGGGCQRSS